MRELITEFERSNGYGVKREGAKRGKTFYQVSPKNIRKRAERAGAVTPDGAKVYAFDCRYPPCGRPFKTTNPFLRYCCDDHRTIHLRMDDQDETRGGAGRHRITNAGDGDGAMR